MAYSIINNQLLDMTFSSSFFQLLLSNNNNNKNEFYLNMLQNIKPNTYKIFYKLQNIATNYQKYQENKLNIDINTLLYDNIKIIDLGLTFVNPDVLPIIELKNNGSQINVNLDNLQEYIDLNLSLYFDIGIKEQIQAIKDGWLNISNSYHYLSILHINELSKLFSGDDKLYDFSITNLQANTYLKGGYTNTSPTIKMLFKLLSSFNIKEQRNFIKFISGTSRLPIGGLMNLSPRLTIIKTDRISSLPSVMTCSHYLKLPDYLNYEILKKNYVIV